MGRVVCQFDPRFSHQFGRNPLDLGGGGYGKMGLGDVLGRPTPQLLSRESNWSDVSAGAVHSMAVKGDGTLWGWGENYYGQLGDENISNTYIPSQIGSASDWTAVSVGDESTAALKSDGTIWSWGRNHMGQLGLGDTSGRTSPTQIGDDTDWTAINLGKGSNFHVAALKSDGTLWTWGYNSFGQLGLGYASNYNIRPAQVESEGVWVSIALGDSHTVGLKDDGTLWSWGANNVGQGGRGGYWSSISSPARVGIGTDWNAIAAGVKYSMGMKNDGTIWVWGYNFSGQLGLGDDTTQFTPTRVPEPTPGE